jgi:hypothetical protein
MAYDRYNKKILNYLLAKLDIFSRKIDFTFDGNKSIFSTFGILFSLGFYTLFILFFYILIIDLNSGRKYDLKIKTQIEHKNIFSFEASNKILQDFIAIKVRTFNKTSANIDISQFECVYHNINNFNSQNLNSSLNFDANNSNYNEIFLENEYSCYFLIKDIKSHIDLLQIDLVNKNLYNKSDILEIEIIYPTVSFDYDDYNNPMKISYVSETNYYMNKNLPLKTLMITNSLWIIDRGLIFESYTGGSFLSVSDTYLTYTKGDENDNKIYSIKLIFDVKNKKYSFVSIKFQDLFAKIYCLIQLTLFIFKMLMYFPSNLNYSVKLNNLITKIYDQSKDSDIDSEKSKYNQINHLPVHKIILKREMTKISDIVKKNTNIDSEINGEEEKGDTIKFEKMKLFLNPRKKKSGSSLSKSKINFSSSNKIHIKTPVISLCDNYHNPQNIDILSMKIHHCSEGPIGTDSNVIPLNGNFNNLNLQPKSKISIELSDIIKSQKENKHQEDKKEMKKTLFLKFSCCGIFINKIFKENSIKEKILYKSFKLIDDYVKRRLEIKCYLDLFNELRVIKKAIFKPELLCAMNYIEHPSFLYMDIFNENKIDDFLEKSSTNKELSLPKKDTVEDCRLLCEYFAKKVFMGKMLPEDNAILFSLDKPQIEDIIEKLQIINDQLSKGISPEFKSDEN